MKKLIFTFICLFSLTLVFAQGGGKGKGKGNGNGQGQETPEQRATKRTDKMGSVVGFTGTQRDQVYAVELKTAQDMMAIRKEIQTKYPKKEDREANRDAIKTEFGARTKAVRENQKAQLDKILTEDQKKKWKEYKEMNKDGNDKEEHED